MTQRALEQTSNGVKLPQQRSSMLKCVVDSSLHVSATAHVLLVRLWNYFSLGRALWYAIIVFNSKNKFRFIIFPQSVIWFIPFFHVWTELLTHINVDLGAIITRLFFQSPHKWQPWARRLWPATGCTVRLGPGHYCAISNIMLYWTTFWRHPVPLPWHKFLHIFIYICHLKFSYSRTCIISQVIHRKM